jgi:hypothetical protein
MSFELPRAPVSLRFTGALKALGQERPKVPPPSPGRRVPPPLPKSSDVYVQDVQPTPYVGSRPSERAERAALPVVVPPPLSAADQAAKRLASLDPKVSTVRGQLASFDDDVQTLALDRDELGLGLGGIKLDQPAKPPAPNLPVPGFRSVEQVEQRSNPTVVRPRRPAASSSLSVTGWLCIAVIAAVVSYSFAPEVASGLEEAVRALSGR